MCTPLAAFWLPSMRGDGEVDFAGHDFAEELGHCQVGEEVGADLFERDDDGSVVLRHEEEQGVHGSPQIMPMAFI